MRSIASRGSKARWPRSASRLRTSTIVIASHLHFDHVGGLTKIVDGAPVPTFPNAVHHVRRGEWEDATHPHERNRASYLPDDFRAAATPRA